MSKYIKIKKFYPDFSFDDLSLVKHRILSIDCPRFHFSHLSFCFKYLRRLLRQSTLYLKYKYLVRQKNSLSYLYQKNGVFPVRLKDSYITEFIDILKDDIADLYSSDNSTRKSSTSYDCAKVYTRKYSGQIINQIETRLKNGLLAIEVGSRFLSDYYLHSFTLHLSRPQDSHHYDISGDPEHISSLHQLHYDPDPLNIKLITYLSDVSDHRYGPFSYVPYNRYKIHFANRVSGAAMCGLTNFNDINTSLLYKLIPKPLHFFNIIGSLVGEHDINSSRFLSTLKSDEVFFYTDDFNSIFFDPQGFHRGGYCLDGKSRLNLQCIFKPL
ncbi:hypothetical protein SynRS9915_00501 [Synechococcus sp. RS9915]|nr:hypothetical protein SynRS9915_00501 [Synechococcus sp. RS9915]